MRRVIAFAAAGMLAAGIGIGTLAARAADKTAASRTLADAPVAHATVHGSGDNRSKIHGTVTFTQEGNGVHIVAHIMGLTPGKHGFHIHEKPDVSSPDMMSAGAHWNPDKHKHGGPESAEHHAGDLGNLEADSEGHAMLDKVFEGISISGHNAVAGHSVIIHEKADDLKSQPAGDSGKRIAGGVIEAGEGEHREH